MNEVVLRRSISPDELRDMSKAGYWASLRGMVPWLVLACTVVVAGAGLLLGWLFSLFLSKGLGYGAGFGLVLLVAVVMVVIWLVALGIGFGIGIPLGLKRERDRLEDGMGPQCEYTTTWYQNGFVFADWNAPRFIPFSDINRVLELGRYRQFVGVVTQFRLTFRPKIVSLPVDLVPKGVMQQWAAEGVLR
jgi:hypothetical protein